MLQNKYVWYNSKKWSTKKSTVVKKEKEELVERVSWRVFVDKWLLYETDLPKMIEWATMTEYKIPEKVLDLEYYFPYGVDK